MFQFQSHSLAVLWQDVKHKCSEKKNTALFKFGYPEGEFFFPLPTCHARVISARVKSNARVPIHQPSPQAFPARSNPTVSSDVAENA